jgi:hypothetical protein
MKLFLSSLAALWLIPVNLFAWTSGELLIWMDLDRAQALQPLAKKIERDLGIKIAIQTQWFYPFRPAPDSWCLSGPDWR